MSRVLAVALAFACAAALVAQTPAQRPTANVPDDVQVRPIQPPAHPLPPESATARIRKFSFIAYGDVRSPGPSRPGDPAADGRTVQAAHTAVVDAMLATVQRMANTDLPVRFVVFSGDAVLYGPNGAMLNVSYIPVAERITVAGGLPLFFAPGNHDLTARPLGDAERNHGLRNTLSAVSKLIPPEGSPRRLSGYATYAFGYGNSFFVLFDSNIASDQKQFEWVRTQLEGIDRRRYHQVFAVFHHPPFDSGQYGGKPQPTSQAVRDLYLPLFRKHHVRMTIAGHDHLLDHFVERYEDGGREYRMDHLVSGGGGAPTYVYTDEPELDSYLKANASQHVRIEHIVKPGAVIEENPHHFVLIRVDGDDVSLEPIASNNAPFQPYGRQRLELK